MTSYLRKSDLYPDGEYGLYLRKSRADLDAEAHGEGETLLRHERALMNLAKKLNIRISTKYIYREVVSGETIAARPEVQRMLYDVESGTLAGIFVMEIERLARGDTSDQGTVAKAFKQFDTLIITPSKTYNPANESDEEYFEFGLFMSRREFKTINRRIQSGRVAAATEGRYIASTAPFGYERIKIKNDKGYTLKIIPEQAEVVKSIFEWHAIGVLQDDGYYTKLGATRIADKLNQMGIKPIHNDQWTKSSVIDILRNPVYAGKIRWGYKKEKKYVQDNKVCKQRYKSTKYSIADGIHDAIISMKLFDDVQDILSQRGHSPIPGSDILKNPLTGIIYCGKCGRMMTRLAKTSKTPYDTIKCMNTKCDNISSPLYLVEEVIITSLKQWLNAFKIKWIHEKLDRPYENAIHLKLSVINHARNDLDKLSGQRDRIYTLLEQGVYSTDIFIQRNKKLSKDIEELEDAIVRYENELSILQDQAAYNDVFIPRAEYLLDIYFDLDNATARNEVLKEILERVEYVKNEPNKKGNRDNKNFEIEIFPKVTKF
jgi:DNA invertase Pin-like site-specific DNA recombinase